MQDLREKLDAVGLQTCLTNDQIELVAGLSADDFGSLMVDIRREFIAVAKAQASQAAGCREQLQSGSYMARIGDRPRGEDVYSLPEKKWRDAVAGRIEIETEAEALAVSQSRQQNILRLLEEHETRCARFAAKAIAVDLSLKSGPGDFNKLSRRLADLQQRVRVATQVLGGKAGNLPQTLESSADPDHTIDPSGEGSAS